MSFKNYSPCSLAEEWTELYKCLFEEYRVLLVFGTFSVSVTKATSAVQRRPTPLQVTMIDEDVILSITPDSHPALTISYINRPLRLSAAVRVESKLGMKQYNSEEKGRMFVQVTRKIIKLTKTMLETGGSGSGNDMKKEDVAD